MDNVNDILLSAAAFLGTLLALLLTFYNNQNYESERTLENVLVKLSDTYASFDIKSQDYYIRFNDISIALNKYKFVHQQLSSYVISSNKTEKICKLLAFIITIIFVMSSILCFNKYYSINNAQILPPGIIFVWLLMSFLFIVVHITCFLPLINHLIPPIPPNRFPTAEYIISPNSSVNVDNVNLIENLSMQLFTAINVIILSDSTSSTYTHYLALEEIDTNIFKTVATIYFPSNLKIIPIFSGDIIFKDNKDKEYIAQISNNDISYNDDNVVITISIPIVAAAIKSIRMNFQPFLKNGKVIYNNIKYELINNDTFVPHFSARLSSGHSSLSNIKFIIAEEKKDHTKHYFS